MELFTFQRLDLISIGHDDVEESLGGCAKEIGQIRRVNPQAKIGRVIERDRPSHEQASRSIQRYWLQPRCLTFPRSKEPHSWWKLASPPPTSHCSIRGRAEGENTAVGS